MSAREMLDASLDLLPHVDGVIAVAAVADFRPATRLPGKLHRTGEPIHLELVPNPDILAELCRRKMHRWAVGFAVESDDLLQRAQAKLTAKRCDAIVVNRSSVMESADTQIQLLDRSGKVVLEFDGPKAVASERIIDWIARNLISEHAIV
jgi:phosphopantothenoylcysteine decarboxylase/phosphopantothenate--cysteine ligase